MNQQLGPSKEMNGPANRPSLHQACVEALHGRQIEIGDQFRMEKNLSAAIPDAPKAPEHGPNFEDLKKFASSAPTHPLGDEYESVIHCITETYTSLVEANKIIKNQRAMIDGLETKLDGVNTALKSKLKNESIGDFRKDMSLKLGQGYEAYFGLSNTDGLTFLREWLEL